MESEQIFEIIGTEHEGGSLRHAEGASPTYAAPPTSTGQPAAGGLDFEQWRIAGNGVYMPSGPTAKQLPAGVYRPDQDGYGNVFLSRVNIITDGLVNLCDSQSARVVASIQDFWSKRERFVARRLLFKRGILLWGPAGSGKTSTLQLLVADLVEKNGVIVHCTHPFITTRALESLRLIEPTRPLIVLLEDLDELADRHGETELLALLDGEAQLDCVCFIGTTNHPEKLDKRFINRPSRFDEVIFIGMPSAAAREQYLKARLTESDLAQIDLGVWVRETEGLSIAHLRELIVAVVVLERSFADTVERLRKMKVTPSSDRHPGKGVGFGH